MAPANASRLGSWEELYQAALLENEPTKLTELLAALEAAIVRRRKELCNFAGHEQEFASMVLAGQAILNMKTERLGWPRIGSSLKRNEAPDVVDKLRRVESIHHWHRGQQ